MAYVQEKFISADKNIMMVKKYHNLFAMPTKETLRKKRGPKVNQETESQKKKNERRRKEKNMRLLADNFKAGDYYITFTTAEKLTPEEFKAEMRAFMQRLRREYKRRMNGETLKFFRVIENMVGRGRPHAHMLVTKFCEPEIIRGLLDGMWAAGHVRVDIYGGKAQDAYNVASYFTKQDKKDHGARIDTSRGNLIHQKPKKEIIHRETFRDEIIAPKGYYVVKNLSYNTKTDSGDYQMAVFQKIEGVKSKNDRSRRMAEKGTKKVSRCSKSKSRNAARKKN